MASIADKGGWMLSVVEIKRSSYFGQMEFIRIASLEAMPSFALCLCAFFSYSPPLGSLSNFGRLGEAFLLHNFHLIQQITCSGKFVDYKKCIANIDGNISTLVGVEHNIAHCSFPATVEVYTN